MIDEIKKYDINFNETKFISKVDRIFILILDSIMQSDIKLVDHYVNDDVCNYISSLISQYNEKNVIRIFDESNISMTKITDFNYCDNKLFITVELTSKYMDYFIDKETSNYVSGINEHRIEMIHKIVFFKDINTKEYGIVTKCPNCGNSLNTNISGVCDFCHNIISMEDYDYVICSINNL